MEAKISNSNLFISRNKFNVYNDINNESLGFNRKIKREGDYLFKDKIL